MATATFISRVIELTPAKRDQDHIPMVVISTPQIPDRSAAILSGKESPLPSLIASAKALERMQANFIVMPCNTAHRWFADIQRQVNIPLLHIVEAVMERLRRRRLTKCPVGLLATNGTLASGIYAVRILSEGYTLHLPDKKTQARVMEGIHAVKSGDLKSPYRALAPGARGLLEQGCAAVILGCTEIPIALERDKPFLDRYIDSIEALAYQTVQFAGSAPTVSDN
ncbi:MAG: aspartate/glutamate racemase family protein [Vampirovibrionales bacterium]|nr:aspartate/glutamate racemase family protein [Vampirovibrionales bacterium]